MWLVMAYAVFMVGWTVVALPLLAGAVIALIVSGNAVFVLAWVAVSAV